jgi:hypothetical protein
MLRLDVDRMRRIAAMSAHVVGKLMHQQWQSPERIVCRFPRRQLLTQRSTGVCPSAQGVLTLIAVHDFGVSAVSIERIGAIAEHPWQRARAGHTIAQSTTIALPSIIQIRCRSLRQSADIIRNFGQVIIELMVATVEFAHNGVRNGSRIQV